MECRNFLCINHDKCVKDLKICESRKRYNRILKGKRRRGIDLNFRIERDKYYGR